MKFYYTDRNGGASSAPFATFNLSPNVGDDPVAVAKNRETLATKVEVAPAKLFFMEQVHGNEIALIDKDSDPTIHPTADALITRELNYGLAVLFADCAPLLLSSKQVSAAVHVGRKGLLADIVDKVVTQMRDMGAIGISAQIGPTICGKCYEVSEEMRDEAEDFMPIAASQTRRSAPSIDIPKAIISILSTAQIPGKWNGVCTNEDQSFFSCRRDRLTGRQAGVVVHGRR